MTEELSKPAASNTGTRIFDELRWVLLVKHVIEQTLEEADAVIRVSVFCVPKTLLATKPEAYLPQLFAIGPYHHWDPDLYEMERYKLATAKNTKKLLKNVTVDQLIQFFIRKEPKIRSHYHRHLEYNGETLAWMMTIDGAFLLEFLRSFSDSEARAFKKIPSMSHMVDSKRIKFAYNSIIRDVVMLENQIPLFVMRRILIFQSNSEQDARVEFSKMLNGFLREVIPFKVTFDVAQLDLKQYAHLLQLLYRIITTKARDLCKITSEIVVINIPDPNEDKEKAKCKYLPQVFSSAWQRVSGSEVIKNMIGKPIKFLLKMPWAILSKIPIASTFLRPFMNLFSKDEGSGDDEDSTKPPLVEEIMIPSVTDLVKAGVKLTATKGDLTTIAFNVKTGTLCIPTVSVDVNTEVVLRNLVAYETSVESGPIIFTRYTELINGIIDTEEDVKVLRQSGIIVNRMKSDQEVADMWNGMSKSVRLSKVDFIDKVIVDVNNFYNSRWRVKATKCLKSYVFGSWKFLTLIATIMLLFLTFVQAFCSVYSCGARISSLTGGDQD